MKAGDIVVSDPFAVLDEPALVADQSSLDSVLEAKTGEIDVPSGSVFVYDFETVPDESRFPRPVPAPKVQRPDAPVNLENLVQQTVPSIKGKIPLLSESQLVRLAEIENSIPKARAGVLDAIKAQQDADNADDHAAEMAEWQKLAINPLACRIVALGIKSEKHRVTMLAKNADEERELLRVLWLHVARFRTRCGYNITGYDDAVLIARSMLLGVDATEKITRKKFGDRASIDLMTAMFPATPAQKLKDVCRMLGIVPPAGYEMDGGQVFGLVDAGKWDEVAAYVSSDADVEFELYSKLSEYLIF